MPQSTTSCKHPDIRKFDWVRTCLACGTTIFEEEKNSISPTPVPAYPSINRTYNYRPLKFELGLEVRLVVVQPGEISAPIHCDIIHVNLEDEPDYDAISYTWADENGNDTKTHIVYCVDGTTIAVTANCEAALRRLRSRGLKKRLWIYAICINQDNISERNHQVGLMDRVYSKAVKVYICIHYPGCSHEKAMAWLSGADTVPSNDRWLLQSFKAIFALRWFRRVWVIQEVTLSNAAVLCVNETEVLLTHEVLQRLRNYCNWCNLEVPGPLRWSLGTRATYNLIACLDATRNCLSNDPRDKIYAILSLVDSEYRKLIPIDYPKDMKWLSMVVFMALVRYSGDLDILVLSTCSSDYSEHLSWVPDWNSAAVIREHIEQFAKLVPGYSEIRFASTTAWKYNVAIQETDEHIKNVLPVDIIIKPTLDVIQFLPPDTQSLFNTPRLWLQAHLLDVIPASKSLISTTNCREFCNQIYADASVLRYFQWVFRFFRDYPSSSGPPDQFWDIQLASILHDFSPTTRSIVRSEIPPIEFGTNLEDLAAFIQDGKKWGGERDVFVSRYSIGFTAGSYREGDKVFAIDGAKSPFILRSVGMNQYRIVSDCYLWAALELDYWNPGTHKGLWKAEYDEPREQQKRMIELL